MLSSLEAQAASRMGSKVLNEQFVIHLKYLEQKIGKLDIWVKK